MRAFWDPVQLDHAPQFFLQRGQVRPNFERPDRAVALLSGLASLGIAPEPPTPAILAELRTVHDADYLSFLEHASAAWAALPDTGPELVPNVHPSPEMLAQGAVPGGLLGQLGWYTADTSCPIGPATWRAAVGAASCAVAAAGAVIHGGTAYALARPPGHHAYPARAGGHCYLNNTALAAGRLLALGAARVGVLDIDSHHGNGTQGVFWTRADVTTVSIHGDPSGYYPWYVGHATERGAGAGAGYNHNYPLPRGTTDAAWLDAIAHGLTQLADADALIIALGFDASAAEPLAFLHIADDGFSRAASLIAARRLPTVLVQEGGYNTATLGPLLARFLEALA